MRSVRGDLLAVKQLVGGNDLGGDDLGGDKAQDAAVPVGVIENDAAVTNRFAYFLTTAAKAASIAA